MIAAILLAFLIQVAEPAAVLGEAPLSNPRLEERAQTLMREIRCVVCENEPVSQSTADIAIDMRRLIRTMVEDGKSDDDVRHFFSARYGDHVLFRPPTDGLGILLWIFPFLLLIGVGGFLGYRAFSHRKRDLAPVPDDGRPLE
jgi:cytochrome c-type biogenesis protein CcmH